MFSSACYNPKHPNNIACVDRNQNYITHIYNALMGMSRPNPAPSIMARPHHHAPRSNVVHARPSQPLNRHARPSAFLPNSAQHRNPLAPQNPRGPQNPRAPQNPRVPQNPRGPQHGQTHMRRQQPYPTNTKKINSARPNKPFFSS